MKQITNEERASIFCLYQKFDGNLKAVTSEGINVTMDYTVRYESRVTFSDGCYARVNNDMLKLILKPLSAISDEDCLQLAAILVPNWAAGEGVQRLYVREQLLNKSLPLAAYDYLRSKSYALPYLGIDLFESGIAIPQSDVK